MSEITVIFVTKKMKEVRVRFAPSPTGPLHIGGVRTALYNYLFARKHNGKFILRIEDTDQKRFVEGAEDYIKKSFEWCGIDFNEGGDKGGEFGPYKQSKRSEIYKSYAQQLVENGWAYYAFDTPEQLDTIRSEYEKEGNVFLYNHKNRNQLNNQFSISEQELQQRLNNNTPYVIRFKIPENTTVTFQDIIRDSVKVNSSILDDKVIFKSDGLPTYHLANVIDDHLMKISHVIRGEEWLPSTPLHVLLYKAFGWEKEMPEFAHLPLLLKPTGKGKLSKRDGDKLGFPVFPLEWKDPKSGEISMGYKEEGYFPDAFINILAFLGWNPGTEKELYTKEELIQDFQLEKVGKAGTRFDPEKAKWFNHQFLITKTAEELYEEIKNLPLDFSMYNQDQLYTIIALVKERLNFPHDFSDQAGFFFKQPEAYDQKVIKKKWKDNISELLLSLIQEILSKTEFEADTLKEKVSNWVNAKEIGFGNIMNSLRLCLVGSGKGPDLFQIMEILGKEETISRIEIAVDKINTIKKGS